LFELAKLLSLMEINIYKYIYITIYPRGVFNIINYIKIKEPSIVKYLEIKVDDFISHLNNPSYNLLEYNKYTLYILKKGRYINIKNIFFRINGFYESIGREVIKSLI